MGALLSFFSWPRRMLLRLLGAAPDIQPPAPTTQGSSAEKDSAVGREDQQEERTNPHLPVDPNAPQSGTREGLDMPQQHTCNCSSNEKNKGKLEHTATVLHDVVGDKNIGGDPQEASKDSDGVDANKANPKADSKAYQMVTVFNEVYGNNNAGVLRAAAGLTQESSGIPRNMPPAVPVTVIPVDAHGRPHHVIGRLVGNLNLTEVEAGATFTQKYTFHGSPATNHEAHDEISMLR
ncbi:hypothetical protein BKA70DRAFT_1267984 [Coprinopsis sp. MPI-PUGE-AT-0042]|nr:hypothetical protein BKA70DRAFT_1267984 [Coprinopsis sp. MPI-PUGE-AT-0042]